MKTVHAAEHEYRPDIDGLRALAILGVLVFHVFPHTLPGGFLGVDVFFVISGFLITKHILQSLKSGRFSFLDFYERRARRILPALIAVVSAVSLISWFFLVPFPEFRSLGQSIASVASMSSNIYFHLKSDYFDLASREIPLLHTWSLSIEEQFYLVWPIMLAGIMRVKKQRLRQLVVIALFCFSLTYSQFAAVHAKSAAFYWMPSRAWELLAGAILGLGILPSLQQGLYSRIAANAGLLFIVFSFAIYHEGLPLPGLLSLLPVGGTALFIHANSLPTRALSTLLVTRKPVLLIGLISYSLYLWHWPVLAFMHILWNDLSIGQSLLALLLSLFLAIVSYRFVEQPLRKMRPGAPTVLGAAGFALVALFAFGAAGHFKNGFPERVPIGVRTTARYFTPAPPSSCTELSGGMIGETGSPRYRILVFGDSHAADLCPLLDRIGKEEAISFVLEIRVGCRPYRTVSEVDRADRCNPTFERVLKRLETGEIDAVIVAAAWNSASVIEELQKNRADITASLELIAKIRPVLVVGDVPAFSTPITQCLIRSAMMHRFGLNLACESTELSRMKAEKQQSSIKAILEATNGVEAGQDFFDRLPSYCKETCQAIQGEIPLYRDSNHLTTAGTMLVSEEFGDAIEQIKQKKR